MNENSIYISPLMTKSAQRHHKNKYYKKIVKFYIPFLQKFSNIEFEMWKSSVELEVHEFGGFLKLSPRLTKIIYHISIGICKKEE